MKTANIIHMALAKRSALLHRHLGEAEVARLAEVRRRRAWIQGSSAQLRDGREAVALRPFEASRVPDYDVDDEDGYMDAPRIIGITYAELIRARERLVETRALKKAEHSNEKSALSRFLECHQLGYEDSVHPLLTDRFQTALRDFKKHPSITSGPRAIRAASLPGYLSRLRNLHKAAAEAVGEPLTFADALERAIQSWQQGQPGRTIRQLCTQAGVTHKTIAKWRNGSTCPATPASIVKIAVLENVLGLPSGELKGTLRSQVRRARRPIESKTSGKLHWNWVRYVPVTESLPPGIKEFYGELEKYKVSAHPGRNLVGESLRRKNRLKVGADNKSETFVKALQAFNAMLAWLSLPATEKQASALVRENARTQLTPELVETLAPFYVGKGLRLASLTPGHLVDPELVGEFMDWRTKRAGTQSGFHRDFYIKILSLLHPTTGFLTQRPEYLLSYFGEEPIDITRSDWRPAYGTFADRWRDICREWFEQLRDMSGEVDAHAKSRDPKVRLAPILRLPDPMQVVIEIIDRHAEARPNGKLDLSLDDRVHLAIWYRDQFLLRLISTNPLREKNLRRMTWTGDNRGNLYRTPGGWRLRFEPADFKNQRGAAREHYDVPVSSSITDLVDRYIHLARPIITRNTRTDVVFPSRYGTPFNRSKLSTVIASLCFPSLRQRFPQVIALHSHGFRHIVATSWLRANPGQFHTVAHILHDKLETVIKNYDHSTPEDGLRLWDGWLAGKLRPFSG